MINIGGLILALGFVNSGLTAPVAINIALTYKNDTCVVLACGFKSDFAVAVGLYMKRKSMSSFARTIAIGGNATNCQVTPLPANIKCECVSERYVSCTICTLTVENDDEQWKCAIPSNGIAVFSNTVKIMVPEETRGSEHRKGLRANNVGSTLTNLSEHISWRPSGMQLVYELKRQVLIAATLFVIIMATIVGALYRLLPPSPSGRQKELSTSILFTSAEDRPFRGRKEFKK
ncbi:uncharacterized protein LOC127867068 isoform X2 [Dreissena polymorpha]|uniref:uncharacterized protein LOC127867068 isoform X2 n=1 Tax=Dreissena polymorpha TaxID=45954 RepID=UPI002263E6DB|nr:uncharacterized protein LOC127867068 isoform X2 [Dreissena polymorpha]